MGEDYRGICRRLLCCDTKPRSEINLTVLFMKGEKDEDSIQQGALSCRIYNTAHTIADKPASHKSAGGWRQKRRRRKDEEYSGTWLGSEKLLLIIPELDVEDIWWKKKMSNFFQYLFRMENTRTFHLIWRKYCTVPFHWPSNLHTNRKVQEPKQPHVHRRLLSQLWFYVKGSNGLNIHSP